MNKKSIRICSWNINSVRIRLHHLQSIIDQINPDVICLQETKVQDHLFPIEEIKNMGFEFIAIKGEKSYNGVAILSKKPMENISSLRLFNDDARHINVVIDDINIHNFYVPAGGDEPDININPKFKHKLSFITEMKKYFQEVISENINNQKQNRTILTGDFNIAPFEHDVWSSKSLRNVVSHTNIEREILLDFKSSCKFIDSAREFNPLSEKNYSWWSYRNKDWKKSNRGRRLDHIWVHDDIKDQLTNYGNHIEARDFIETSDHIPIYIDIVKLDNN